jgi:hypothetical protein
VSATSAVERAKGQRLGNNNPLSDAFDALDVASRRMAKQTVAPAPIPPVVGFGPATTTLDTVTVNLLAGSKLNITVTYDISLDGLAPGGANTVTVGVKVNGVLKIASTSNGSASPGAVQGQIAYVTDPQPAGPCVVVFEASNNTPGTSTIDATHPFVRGIATILPYP